MLLRVGAKVKLKASVIRNDKTLKEFSGRKGTIETVHCHKEKKYVVRFGLKTIDCATGDLIRVSPTGSERSAWVPPL